MNVFLILVVVGIFSVLGSSHTDLPLRFLEEPTSAVALKNSEVILNCSATGSSKTTVYWNKDETRLKNTSNRVVLPSGHLVIHRFRSKKGANNDEGVYQCFATNTEGTIASRKARVKVAVLSRKFKEWPRNATVWEGSTGRFACQTKRAVPEPKITWQKNGETLIPDERYVVLPNGALQILNVKKSDQGSYRCIAKNIAKRRESNTGWLTVNTVIPKIKDNPHIAIMPKNTSVVSGHQVIMECIATGVPVPSVQWKKVGGPQRSYDATIANKGSSNLQIRSVSVQDGGEYICIVSGGGKTITKSTFLFVKEPPHFITKPQTQGVAEAGRTIKLHCSATGSPPPRITWLKDGQALSRDNRIMLLHRGLNKDLTISRLSERDAGVYQCFAENDLGSTQSSTRVIVKRAVTNPWPPRNVTAIARSDSEIEVSWKPPLGDTMVLAYSINYQPADKSVREFQVVQQGVRCTIHDLQGYTKYTVYVKPFFRNGSGVKSATITVRTLEGKPASPPTNVRLSSDTPDSIDVKWKAPAKRYQNGKITSYIIRYSLNIGQGVPQSLQAPGSIQQKTITGLKSGQVYKVQVAAATVKGVGPFSQVKTSAVAKRPKNVVSSPRMTINALNSTSLEITWLPPIFGAKRVHEYRLSYSRADQSRTSYGPIALAKHRKRYYLTQLNSNTQYVIRLMAYDGYKSGQPAVDIGRTMSAHPDKVKVTSINAKCVPYSPTSLLVSWKKISPAKVSFYEVRYFIKGNINQRTVSKTKVSTESTLVSGLRPGKTYSIFIAPYDAKEKKIAGVAGSTVECVTPEAKPGSPPRNVHFEVKSATELVMSWEPPLKPNGKITNYVIMYTTDKTLPEKKWIKKPELLSKFFARFEKHVTTKITGLTANVTYYMKIKAGNNQGYGPFTDVKRVLMVVPAKTSITDEAPDISYQYISATSVEVSWRHSLTSLGKPISYKLMYTKNPDLDDSMWYKHVVPVTWTQRTERRVVVQLPSLTVNQTYYVKVQAKYHNQDGSWSKTLKIQIKDNANDGIGAAKDSNSSSDTIPGPTSSDARASKEKEDFDIKLGIIIGCVISAFCIVLLILFIIWRCPCRFNQAKNTTTINMMNGKAHNGMSNGLPKGYIPPITLSHQSVASSRTVQGGSFEESSGGSSIGSSVCQCRCTCSARRWPPMSGMQTRTPQNQLVGNGHIVTGNGHVVTTNQVALPQSKTYEATLNGEKVLNYPVPSDISVPLQVITEQLNGEVVVSIKLSANIPSLILYYFILDTVFFVILIHPDEYVDEVCI